MHTCHHLVFSGFAHRAEFPPTNLSSTNLGILAWFTALLDQSHPHDVHISQPNFAMFDTQSHPLFHLHIGEIPHISGSVRACRSRERYCSGLPNFSGVYPILSASSIACPTFPTPLLACWPVGFSFILLSLATADSFGFTIVGGQHVKIVDGH